MKPFGVVRFTVAWFGSRLLGFAFGLALLALTDGYTIARAFLVGASVGWLVVDWFMEFKSRKEKSNETENSEA